jgi:hypothetical protein
LNRFVIDLLKRRFFEGVALLIQIQAQSSSQSGLRSDRLQRNFDRQRFEFPRQNLSLAAKEVEVLHDVAAWGVLLKLCHRQVSFAPGFSGEDCLIPFLERFSRVLTFD